MQKYLNKLNGWPSIVLGVAVLGVGAYYAFLTYSSLEQERATLLSELEVARDTQYSLLREIDTRQEIIDGFQGQLGKIASTVGTLEKLSNTDEELLAKYSKVYFLNENYVPSRLTVISSQYLNKSATNIEIHADVWPYLEKLLLEASRSDIPLRVASAYRSFQTQSSLKSAYTTTYGSGANKFSADQGYSEHQLGTALDFTSLKLGDNISAFGSDPAYKWLQNNAHNYGFILSYPAGNAYYKFEPWHWRFVGVMLAKRLYDDKKFFYDLDQREIDKTLVNLFD